MDEVVDKFVEQVLLGLEVEQSFVLGKAQRWPADVEQTPQQRVFEDVPLEGASVFEQEQRLPRLELDGRSPPHTRKEWRRLVVMRRVSMPAGGQAPVQSIGRREVRVVRTGDEELFSLVRVELVLDGQLTSEEDLYRQWAKMDLGELVALQGRVELADRSR